jgi:hypothetical protein
MFRHTCEWLLVIIKSKPEQLLPNKSRGVPGV